ncbi:6,7-dimethyl-8-ribityllumazine synthase [Bibersteinia trehalosi]|uniref:6,7-dimethyl-8-ribityllumazine synthase n=4 Tax=Bibersteinia trehalosi TaxID=47735 RepID=W0R9C1_BIBTR|nr:6,7-dimethyl-8-ribityllumazine synthase [Bibersteinia trehalosi]AGH39122.1 6,7-dimethyl-8-ribityllumazine synthase [Bibersteinia trehalosi USDA-ARS-USMARC-192]AHG83342.1 6,7-dimethyl-8-ribityllumazine synthase [Bibersteinia trehalosi USDA-ARS-USMARC-189]AHG87052.1 6,7-dimethyl-8-ribityllumazine synthase [Bibersteinia trehalosi USDA-ARS-USMARC-190]OAQ14345.1 6,7-dimethyl-8-ribityllumazine synthase [Bibersteinia trehalosi Y31]RRN01570.1 6,7-dimethyl-8-ribityllumazine synthase [Bibersteinia tr
MATIQGNYVATGLKFGIVATNWHKIFIDQLLHGAKDKLIRHGVNENDIDTVWVPGALEIAIAAKKMAESGKYDAIICLGAVVRGATSHYDVVVNESAKGIAMTSLQTGVPIANGVLTVENLEQAIERSGTKAGNKGEECAMVAIEMVNLLKQL